MGRLLILGASGCGREVLLWAEDINRKNGRWSEIAFVDYDTNALDGKKTNANVIANDDDIDIYEDDEFICAIGDSKLRRKITEKIKRRGGKFTNIIHPTAIIGSSASMGTGVIIYPYSIITADVMIGDGCIINMGCSVAHDVQMGDYCTLSPNCDIAGGCSLGNSVFLGVGSHIIPSIKLEDGAYVCAGSTVMTRVKKEQKVIGCPAKVIRNW